jgi:hypothetical protein
MKVVTVSAGLVAVACCAMAQSPPSPPACSAAEHRQFDFWIGRWEVFTPDGKKAGNNTIEAIDGGCALIERWQGGGGFTGTSLNSWDPQARQWRQHWIDNQGGLLRLAGALEGGRMVLAATEADPMKPGATLRQRISWALQPDGAVRQHWETSQDEGVTWATSFDGRYVKAK